MRPLKLTMTAFGPYAKNEEIDFTILNNKNIFLITGPTGAGKTTIFDGISYAIYGEASGEDRDGESLRSQFADVDTLTSVELEFELKGTKYYIKRTPKQEKRKSRGEGTTEQKTDAEMKIIHSDEQVKVISGVSNVNDKINEIMGINYAQFKQIMMIPQGEFRKLLVSESKDREKILQKIFGTEAYKLVEIKLNDRAREIKNVIKDLNNKQSENISTIQFDNNTQLMELIQSENRNITEIVTSLESFIEEDIEKRSSLEKSAKEILNELEKNQKKIFEAKENNKKFEEKEELEKIKDKLESHQPIMDLEKERLVKARKAAQIDAVEENYIERHKDLAIKKRELELNQGSIEIASKSLIKAEEALKVENSKEEEKIKLLEYTSVLKGYREKVKVFEDENASLNLIELQLKDVNNKKNVKKQLVEKIKKDIEILSNKLEVVRKASSDYIKLNAELEKTNQIYNK
ncbi:MAG: AAA family ATPase, partial [Clostridiaceae bacterium]|nr:AAA family ATPase [Clostridiaceae bacterium]